MAVYEVTQVDLLPERLEHLREAELELPDAGTSGSSYVLQAAGRIAGRDQDATAVEVVYNDRVIRTCQLRASSFVALIGLVGMKHESEILLRAVLADESRVPIATICVSRSPLRTAYEPELQPLMLTGFARSGSTWVMKLLAAHEQVVASRRFPYESAPAKYWLHALRVLSDPEDHSASMGSDNIHADLGWVGKNPFADESAFAQPALSDWFAREYVEELASFCQRAIDHWYLAVAKDQHQTAPVYFAEKHLGPNYIPVLAWELYPQAKEIFLVRDLRDVASSMLAFFGLEPEMAKEDYLRERVRLIAWQLRKAWRSRQDRAHLLRYEDLVARPAETLGGIFEYLELDATPADIERILAIGAETAPAQAGWTHDNALVAEHRTSDNLEDSIGRWQRDHDPAFQQLLHEVLGDLLEDFGYAGAV